MGKQHNYFFYSQLLVFATLPFHFLASSYAIIISILLFIYSFAKSKSFRTQVLSSLRSNKISHFFILLFILYSTSILIHLSDYVSISDAWNALEKRLSYIILPFLLASFAFATRNQISLVFKVFIGSILLSSILALLIGLYQTLATGSLYFYDDNKQVVFNNFMYHRLGSYVGMHAVYYAEYVLVAFVVWVSYTYNNFYSLSIKKKLLNIGVAVYLITIIFLLKSAAILLILLAIITLFIIYHLRRARNEISTLKKVAIGLVGVILISVLSIRALNKIGSRADYFTYDLSQPGGGDWNAVNLRLAKWHVANIAIRNHWIWGVGPGNTIKTMDKYYEDVGFVYALQLHYNPHNQFLHTFLTLGVFGVATLIGLFLYSLIFAVKRNDNIMVLFLISFLLFSLSESTLVVNKGIIFFTLFLTFFSYLPEKTSYYLNASSDK